MNVQVAIVSLTPDGVTTYSENVPALPPVPRVRTTSWPSSPYSPPLNGSSALRAGCEKDRFAPTSMDTWPADNDAECEIANRPFAGNEKFVAVDDDAARLSNVCGVSIRESNCLIIRRS